MRLFFIISLVDAALCNIVFVASNVCSWHLYEIFAATVMFSSSSEAQLKALWIIQASKNAFVISLMFLTILLNTCLAVDLVLMIKHPFQVKEKRVSIYLAVSMAVTFFLIQAWYFTLEYEPNAEFGLWPLPNIFVQIFALLIMVNYILISTASIIYALLKLCKPGISNESRRLVLLRHVLSIVGFVIAQFYLLFCLTAMLDWYPAQTVGQISSILFAS